MKGRRRVVGTGLGRWVLAACFTMAISSTVAAQSAAPGAIERLIDSLSSTQSLQADFRQTTLASAKAAAGAAAKNRILSGKFSIARPGLLRWEVQKPYAQLQVLDGQQFWIFDPDLAQATVRPLSAAQLSGLAGLLLNSTGLTRDELAKRYALIQLPDRDGLAWIEMTPLHNEPGIAKIAVAIDADAMLRQVEITDALGQLTRIELANVLKNIAINPAIFRFVPPSGVSVLRAP